MKTDLKNRRTLIILLGLALSIILALVFVLYFISPSFFKPNEISYFHTKEIYPTKPGGRTWHLDATNPESDGIFLPGTVITKLQDGSWLVSGAGRGDYQVRMDVITPPGQQEWKNVEITGYVKVLRNTSNDGSIDWYARGGRHSDDVPCEGTSLKGILNVNGMAEWKKEIWHTGGYTESRAEVSATPHSILDRWIGWKVVIYNIKNNTAVKMESYIDENANNNWRKITDLVDEGGWFANSSDKVFNSAHCNKPKDYIITNSGPIAAFRSDNIIWQFKDLSVREINAP